MIIQLRSIPSLQMKRETKNNISFFPKEYFELANSYDYCGKVNLKNDVCLIDSDLIIEEDIRFDNRVVKEGAKFNS